MLLCREMSDKKNVGKTSAGTNFVRPCHQFLYPQAIGNTSRTEFVPFDSFL